MPDLFQLPKYEAAVKRENEIRNAAFLNLPTDICGCKVMQITLWHWIILDGIEAPFINGFNINEPPKPEDVLAFLWVLSKQFYILNRIGISSGWIIEKAKKRFAKRFRKLNYAEVVAACIRFCQDTFQDTLPNNEGDRFKRAPYYSYPSAVIHVIASRYSWDDQKILFKPLKVLLQYQKVIDMVRQLERGDRPIMFNNSDAVKRAEIGEQRAEREKMKLHPGQQVAD